MRRFISSLVVASLCLTGSAAFAQFGAVKEGAEKVGSATKEAGKATVETTKHAAKAAQSSAGSYPGPPTRPMVMPINAASDVRASDR